MMSVSFGLSRLAFLISAGLSHACFGDVTAFVMRPQSAVHRMIHNLAASMGLGSCPGHTPLDETAAVHVRQWVWQKPPLRSLPLT